MNLIEYIDYFEENYISFDFLQNSNNVHISINTEKNNVDISNEHSRNHICIGVETNSEDLESLTPPITIRIYNKNYRITSPTQGFIYFIFRAIPGWPP